MGEKFKDFPCLYYLDGRVDRKNKVQFYSMLASMFGQTPEQAAQASELFAHASGKLFDGTGFPVEEIVRDAGNSFMKPYKDCRGFYKRKTFSEAALKENCCIICPYSHSYANDGLEHERQILHVLAEHRDWFDLAGCSTGDFRSRLALSCTNDISEYPVIPFHAYVFEYLMKNGELEEKEVTLFVRTALGECGQFVPESVLSSFVSLQLGLIARTALIGGDDTSSASACKIVYYQLSVYHPVPP